MCFCTSPGPILHHLTWQSSSGRLKKDLFRTHLNCESTTSPISEARAQRVRLNF